MAQQQQQGFNPTHKDAFGCLLFVARAHATTLTIFLHNGFGTEALGWPGLYAFGLLLLVAEFTADPVFGWYLIAFIIVLICQRLTTFQMVRRGVRQHSLFEGTPLVAMLIPGACRPETVYGVVEPVLCFFTGIALGIAAEAWKIPWLSSLAGWIFLGFFSLGFQYWIGHAIRRRRVQAMRDAQIEQEYLTRMFREEYDPSGRRG